MFTINHKTDPQPKNILLQKKVMGNINDDKHLTVWKIPMKPTQILKLFNSAGNMY